ncbi:hypothetical protein PTI98_011859 [Pleurotus ostreatus]|nr:hypothetical protein PTI98_011859 [Pleurotus ostreatus]
MASEHKGSQKCNENKKKRAAELSANNAKGFFKKYFTTASASTSIVPSQVSIPETIQQYPRTAPSGHSSDAQAPQKPPCPKGVALVRQFRQRINLIPAAVAPASSEHPLTRFAGPPAVGNDEDAWEIYDGPLNTLLQQPEDKLRDLVRTGEKGLLGLCNFLESLVVDHGVMGALFEGKLERLMQAIDAV